MEIRKVRVENDIFLSKIRDMLRSGNHKSVTFVVRGNSMNPFLVCGRDKVILVPPQKPTVGQVVLAEFKPKVYALHRIIKIEGNKITMRGDGNLLSQKEIFEESNIVGTAEGFIRKGEKIDTDSTKWRIYSTVWHWLRPIRRLLLSFYRRYILKLY
ncbi:MAG: S24/S26 family peptidase [Bacteroidaceae bacterium]|nr:S24/S26 family peptidase [Bacteroidaceae bacterium]